MEDERGRGVRLEHGADHICSTRRDKDYPSQAKRAEEDVRLEGKLPPL